MMNNSRRWMWLAVVAAMLFVPAAVRAESESGGKPNADEACALPGGKMGAMKDVKCDMKDDECDGEDKGMGGRSWGKKGYFGGPHGDQEDCLMTKPFDGRGHRGGWNECRTRCPWKAILLFLGILHILLSVIVYKDVRGSTPRMNSLWIVVVLLGGIPATVAYGVMRLVQIKSSGK